MAPMPAMAQTSMPAVAPLGFAIGKATLKEVKAGVPGGARLKNNGTNLYSRGVMLQAQGKAFDIEGLQDVLFIFDEREMLIALVMKMNKNGFDRIYQNLAGKYQLVRKDIPFVGNKFARFQQGKVEIELEAPHLDFTMLVSYATAGFKKQVEQDSHLEAVQKQKREAGKF